MLDISRDIICRLIILAREFHAQEEVVIPENPVNPSGDWAQQTLASHMDDSTYREFRAMVRDLEPDQRQQLVALMWLGRGDYSLDEWQDAVMDAAENASRNTPQYLMAHPQIADFMMEGLEIFGISCDDE